MPGQFLPLRISNEGAVKHQNFSLRAAFIQYVFKISKARFQAHHAVFAQAVNRRVGHLREILPEIMRQRAIFFRQDRARRIITHRCKRFFAIFGHRRQNLFELFDRISRSNLPLTQICAGKQRSFGDACQRRV